MREEQPAGEEQQIIVVESAAILAQEKAAIDVQIATAHAFPRVISRAQERVYELATVDKQTAASCWYRLPARGGGKPIIGPSVRLAEIVAASWGNLRVEARIVDIGERSLTAQAACHDLENNTALRAEVHRSIISRKGERFNDEMIAKTASAACSVALRNAVFRVVPLAAFKSVMTRIHSVAFGNDEGIEGLRRGALDRLGEVGVSEADALAYCGARSPDDLNVEHCRDLHGIAESMAEGSLAWPGPGEATQDGPQKALTEAKAAIGRATNMDDLKAAFGPAWKKLPANSRERKELEAAKDARKGQLDATQQEPPAEDVSAAEAVAALVSEAGRATSGEQLTGVREAAAELADRLDEGQRHDLWAAIEASAAFLAAEQGQGPT